MAVFYQTYRPKNFSEVIGQEAMLKALQNASASGSLGHAYLFTGGRGLGKTTLARILAKATNCGNVKQGDPCGVCETCLAIARGKFLDVIEIDAASHTGVDNIRELIENIQFQPSYGKTKVFIIDEVHMLSKAAFNALLKTLEEPPAHAMFILATTDAHKLPETIISRTQRFDFRSISAEEIKKVLEKISKSEKLHLPDGALGVIVENSQGGLRDALSQLGAVAALPKNSTLADVHEILGTTSEQTVREMLELIVQGSSEQLPGFFENLASNNLDSVAFIRKTLKVLQELLENNLSQKKSDELAIKFSISQLLHVIRLFLRAFKESERSISPELPALLASIEAAQQFATSSQSNGEAVAKKKVSSTVKLNSQAVTQPNQPQEIEAKSNEALEQQLEQQIIASQENVEANESQNSETALEFNQVKQWWDQLITEIKTHNSPLATLLKNSPICKVEGNTVVVAVKYLFHKENLENTKHRSLIVQTASKLAGAPVSFRALIKKIDQDEREAVPKEAALADALQIFGGELIE